MFETGAHTDWTSFICHLLIRDVANRHDAPTLFGEATLFKESEEWQRQSQTSRKLFLAQLAMFVHSGHDPVFIQQAPDELHANGWLQLDHERMHYWQLLGYPILQMQFLLHLERMRHMIADQGGNAYKIAGMRAWPNSLKRSRLDTEWQRLELQMSARPEDLIHSNITETEGRKYPTEIGVTQGTDGKVKAIYAGTLMRLSRNNDFLRVPFDVQHLLEAAVAISEVLEGRRKVPQADDLSTADELLYWGCWFYWNDIHSTNDLDETTLMLTFLAAVDLALMGDYFMSYDNEFRGEDATHLSSYTDEISIPYRFYKIAQLPIPNWLIDTLVNHSATHPLTEYQVSVSKHFGWRDPTEVVGAQLLRLTCSLGSFLWQTDLSAPSPGWNAAKRLAGTPASQWQKSWDDFESVWSEISDRHYRKTDLRFIGYSIIATMLNYMVSRLASFDTHIVLCSNLYEKRCRFSLPLVKFDGHYFQDQPVLIDDIFTKHFIRVDPFQVPTDCLELAVLMPIATEGNNSRCGLMDRYTGEPFCSYISAGLGCPHNDCGLTSEQERFRRAIEIDNYCHWTWMNRKMGTVA
jgi:hypothetical protein